MVIGVKFWQRAYLSILLLFVLFFYVSIYMVSDYAYRTSLGSERERSFGEAGFIMASLARDMTAISENGDGVYDGGYSFFQRYADFYETRNIYLELWWNGEYLTGNIPNSPIMNHETGYGEQKASIVEYGQNRFMLVAGSFMFDSDRYTLIYAHDLQGFADEHNALTRFR